VSHESLGVGGYNGHRVTKTEHLRRIASLQQVFWKGPFRYDFFCDDKKREPRYRGSPAPLVRHEAYRQSSGTSEPLQNEWTRLSVRPHFRGCDTWRNRPAYGRPRGQKNTEAAAPDRTSGTCAEAMASAQRNHIINNKQCSIQYSVLGIYIHLEIFAK
jgi:hypothetical protein